MCVLCLLIFNESTLKENERNLSVNISQGQAFCVSKAKEQKRYRVIGISL